eukprot:5774062-Lingulodinium_polyedra.AAC.1
MLATSPEGGLWQRSTNAGTPLHTKTCAVASAARKKVGAGPGGRGGPSSSSSSPPGLGAAAA